VKELQMTTTAAEPARVITDREIGAAELQMAINARRGTATPQWIQELAHLKLKRAAMTLPGAAA
jgi:hypothetical protein